MSATLAVAALLATAANALIDFQPCPGFNANITRIIGVEGTPVECAHLSVPLDYTDQDPDSEQLTLDLFRVTATQEPVLGTVIMNFGGPGGTAGENLPVWATQAQEYIGPQWNVLSWDPRGTGNTIPFRCDVEAVLGGNMTPTKRDIGNLVTTNVTEAFLNGGWDLAGEVADYCAAQASDVGTLIGTAFTARDMINIVDALEEDGLLRYYGWSYGTALGSYAAAMFPERVERMVLDGNVNPHDYQAGHYGEYLDDIDSALSGFIETCFNVTDDCPLYTLVQPESAQDLLDAINLVLAPLAQNATSGLEAYLNFVSAKSIFIEPLYFPRTWPNFALSLVQIYTNTTPPSDNTTVPKYGAASNAVFGIRASDATFIANFSDEYLPQERYQSSVSASFGDIGYYSLWVSARWSMHARERYWGDFNVQTKVPILYVNGEHDPVTPLVNAYNGSSGFTGSVVLPHSGYGHGIFTDPSTCVAQHTRRYFVNGTLPEAGAHCEPDMSLVETWREYAQRSGVGNATSGGNNTGNGNGTSENSSDGNGTVEHTGNSVRLGSGAGSYSFGAVLAVVMMWVL
ncbi:hypothetical protein H2200_003568 [Cladophialophora chaetospira]|uniref:Peptidase S33 tripeptidyl aminopeptidase-like C-terminal domain-containing protein n=1 Tax=Cladophialophora chaetospira TaxID=386627 RepID=A0AA39CL78_9EURO|nr:hypothetical protein H2200_003568 [Cladophialophora chaetospira]